LYEVCALRIATNVHRAAQADAQALGLGDVTEISSKLDRVLPSIRDDWNCPAGPASQDAAVRASLPAVIESVLRATMTQHGSDAVESLLDTSLPPSSTAASHAASPASRKASNRRAPRVPGSDEDEPQADSFHGEDEDEDDEDEDEAEEEDEDEDEDEGPGKQRDVRGRRDRDFAFGKTASGQYPRQRVQLQPKEGVALGSTCLVQDFAIESLDGIEFDRDLSVSELAYIGRLLVWKTTAAVISSSSFAGLIDMIKDAQLMPIISPEMANLYSLPLRRMGRPMIAPLPAFLSIRRRGPNGAFAYLDHIFGAHMAMSILVSGTPRGKPLQDRNHLLTEVMKWQQQAASLLNDAFRLVGHHDTIVPLSMAAVQLHISAYANGIQQAQPLLRSLGFLDSYSKSRTNQLHHVHGGRVIGSYQQQSETRVDSLLQYSSPSNDEENQAGSDPSKRPRLASEDNSQVPHAQIASCPVTGSGLAVVASAISGEDENQVSFEAAVEYAESALDALGDEDLKLLGEWALEAGSSSCSAMTAEARRKEVEYNRGRFMMQARLNAHAIGHLSSAIATHGELDPMASLHSDPSRPESAFIDTIRKQYDVGLEAAIALYQMHS